MSSVDSELEDKLSNLVNSYDLEGIITISKKEPEGDVDVWRNTILESGFISLYSYLSYDQMCGKLGDGGLDMMDEIIIAAETFKGSPLRVLRAEVLNYRMDKAGANRQEAIVFAQQAIDELSFEIPEDKRALSFRANLYHELSQLDVNKALQYWQLAIEDLRTAGDFNVWILYSVPKHSVRGLNEAQQTVQAEFSVRMAGELLLDPDRIWELLDRGIRMLDGNTNVELERQISRWLQTSLSWNT